MNLEAGFARHMLLSLSSIIYGSSGKAKMLTSLLSRTNRFFFQTKERLEIYRYLSAHKTGVFPSSGGGSKATNEVVMRRARQAPLHNPGKTKSKTTYIGL